MLDSLISKYLQAKEIDLKALKSCRGFKSMQLKSSFYRLVIDIARIDKQTVAMRLQISRAKLETWSLNTDEIVLNEQLTLKLIYYKTKEAIAEKRLIERCITDEFEATRRVVNNARAQIKLIEYKLENLRKGRPINGTAEDINPSRKHDLSYIDV